MNKFLFSVTTAVVGAPFAFGNSWQLLLQTIGPRSPVRHGVLLMSPHRKGRHELPRPRATAFIATVEELCKIVLYVPITYWSSPRQYSCITTHAVNSTRHLIHRTEHNRITVQSRVRLDKLHETHVSVRSHRQPFHFDTNRDRAAYVIAFARRVCFAARDFSSRRHLVDLF